MLSSAEVPTLLFEIWFACFNQADFAYNRLTSHLQRILPDRGPERQIVRHSFALRTVPARRRLHR